MDEYYIDLKKAVAALEKFTASLNQDDYNSLFSTLKRISQVQKEFHPL